MTHPQLRGVTARSFVAALERDGFIWLRGEGSHRVYGARDGRVVVVAMHGAGATFPRGTLHQMLRGARWTKADLRRLGLVT